MHPVQREERSKSDRIFRLPEVLARTGLGRSTLYAMVERGAVVRPIRLGARAVGWRESELADWLAARPRTNA